MSCLFLFITAAAKLTPMASGGDSDDCSRYAVGNCLSDAHVLHASHTESIAWFRSNA